MTVGRLILSLDFELHWGVRDHTPVARYRERLDGVWTAIPALLDVFAAYGTRATWATVGFLFARDRDELEAFSPTARPSYADSRLSPYGEPVGRCEDDDPYHFAPSLVRAIAGTPGQELGTHTWSHYYTLEDGQTDAEYVADLRAALALARHQGYALRSIVFPRNQHARRHLAPLPGLGITAFRGAAAGWLNTPGAAAEEQRRRRALRLLDAYLPISGSNQARSGPSEIPGLADVPASRFLRPWTPRLRHLDRLRLRRITRDLERVARDGGDYHLWWHPHNFGAHLTENLDFLRRVLDAAGEVGLRSVTMGERADEILASRAVRRA